MMVAREAGHYVYIVRCGDGTLYTGYARDPQAREIAHNNGRGAKYTAGRRPVTLVHIEMFGSKGQALRREHEIKRWPRNKKQSLCSGTPQGRPERRRRP
jgi:predicted GIY-YIG superfamily endonuclease